MSVAGTYEVTTKTPMGDQKGTFTVEVERRQLHRQRNQRMMGTMESKPARSAATRSPGRWR